MKVNQATHSVGMMCRLLEVSRSGFYAWVDRPLCARRRRDLELTGKISAIHRRSRETYGSPSIHAELADDHGLRVGRKRVARLMRQNGLRGATLRKYVYDPLNVPQHPFGDLQPPEDVVEMSDGRLEDMLTGGTLTVYTTAYDEQAPAAVSGLTTTSTPEGVEVTWDASADEDLCYYRVYRAAREPVPLTVQGQIASTVANRLLDRTGHRESRYAVVAVDKSGNAGPAGAGRLQGDAP